MTERDKITPEMTTCLLDMFSTSKKRAKTCGFEFDLSQEWLFRAYNRNHGACSLTGIEFSVEKYKKSARRPFIPSIDRISNGQGYLKSNCRLVIYAANVARNEWDDEVLLRVMEGLLTQKRQEEVLSPHTRLEKHYFVQEKKTGIYNCFKTEIIYDHTIFK